MCLMSSCKGIDIWLEIGEFQAQVSTHFQITQMGFQSSYSILEFIDPKGSIWTTLATPGLDQLAAAINSP
ncbi:hypothetical protein T02_7614 [Trichinella nativa]|uniref:Uncharacterized protein n=1 Tax=Trichinella nativa TaxID=6335 RepID=A0A0V1KTI3_9BILA|nr:hypothetical protein T02_7614 [Trichinella nativa]